MLADTVLAFVGGTIYVGPSEDPIRAGVVLTRKGKIAAVGGRELLEGIGSGETIDCSGSTVTAGFWNSHVHFFERKWADAAAIPAPELARQLENTLARYGFTSVFDLGSPWENTRRLRERIEAGEVAGPHIRSTGPGLISPGAGPPDLVLAMMGVMKTPLPEIADVPHASEVSRKLLDEGADGIKIFLKPASAGAPSFPDGALDAVVGEARLAGRPVFVHPTSGEDVLTAARSGVDVVAHTTPHSGPWTEAILREMRDAGAALTPTLTLWEHFSRHDRLSAQEEITKTAVGQLAAWNACGGGVLFGTDLGAVDADPSREYALMGDAGLDFRRILTSLTTAPAERFGDPKHAGRVAEGYDADLVVFRGDASKDIGALADVRYTVRGGKVLYRAGDGRKGGS